MKKIYFYTFLSVLVSTAFFSVSDANAALLTGLRDRCLDVAGGNPNPPNGTPVIIFHCHGAFNQQWNVVNGQIVGIGDKCLDDPNFNTANGTKLQIFTCNGGTNQKWTISNNGSIIGLGGKCVDIPGFNTTEGTQVELFTCNGGTNQKWNVR